jgi:hypothetical protein
VLTHPPGEFIDSVSASWTVPNVFPPGAAWNNTTNNWNDREWYSSICKSSHFVGKIVDVTGGDVNPSHGWVLDTADVAWIQTCANTKQGVGIDGAFDAQNDVVQAGTDIWVIVKNGVRFYASQIVLF